MTTYYIPSNDTNAPLSGAIETNGLLFVSGQIHADTELNLQGNTVEERFTATMKNVERILTEAKLSKENIIQVRIYLTDLSELPKLNAVYTEYFTDPLPTRTAVGVKELPLGASLEIEVIASR
jgi:2-iminobutanoate/2-iminopropanoate deaminase